jgi:hypothetical protein
MELEGVVALGRRRREVSSWGGGSREGEIERASWPLGDGDGVKCGMRSDSSQVQSRFDSFFGSGLLRRR